MKTPARTPKTTGSETWADVLNALTGLRLAVYDDVVHVGAHHHDWNAHGLAHHEAVEWLVERRLLAVDTHTGKWRAVPLREAMEKYEQNGPSRYRETMKEIETLLAAPTAQPAVQSHQAQFFDMEGYR
jgi:hypothetical protein